MKFTEKLKFNKLLRNLSISQIDTLNGVEFENFISNLFSYLGYPSSTTSATGDNGIDILSKFGRKTIGIQTKLYYNHNVGNKAIQEVYTGKNFFNLDYAIVCTNWNFSTPAKNLAEKLRVGLIDRSILIEILNNNRKNNKLLIKNIINKIKETQICLN